MPARSTILTLHRWTGVAFALFLLLQGLSGAAMVFRDEAGRLLHGSALRVAAEGAVLPAADLLEAVRAAHPGMTVVRIDYPPGPGHAYLFRLRDGGSLRLASVDPHSGAVLRSAPLAAWPVELATQWHDNMLLGGNGPLLVGVTGCGLLAMALSGPLLWWPGRRCLRQGFTVNLRTGSYRAVLDLHRVAGAVLAAVLGLSALTGIGIAWREPLLPLLGAEPFPAPAAVPGDGPLLPLDAAVAVAREATGGLKIRNLRLPGGRGDVVHLYMEDTAAPQPRAARQLWVDGRTGAVLADYSAAMVPAGNRFLDWMLGIHSGAVGGLPGRLLVLAAGLGLAGLAGTGFWIWRRKRGFRRKLTTRKPAPAKAA